MIKNFILITIIVSLSGCAVDNRSDLAAEHHGYVNNLDLLQIDKKSGVSRKIEKVTRETVDTQKEVHNKVVTIQEELSNGHVKGKAEAEMVFDSKTRERSGKRSLMVEDDGSGSLSEFVEKFETVQYKKIKNDVFVDKSEKKKNIVQKENVEQNNISEKVMSVSPAPEDSVPPASLEGQSVYKMQPVSENAEEDNKILNNSLLKQEQSQSSDVVSEIKTDVLGEVNPTVIQPIILHDFSKKS